MQAILADYTVWITDLKKSPSKIIKNLWDEAVAILNHNAVEAYMVSRDKYEKMKEKIEDLMDLIEADVESRTHWKTFKADFDKNWILTIED